jgi:hypothetical protein
MKRFSVLPLVLFALACGDTPTDVAPDDLALAADHHGNKVVLIVSAGGRSDPTPYLGGSVFPEGTRVTLTFTARMKANGEVSGNAHYALDQLALGYDPGNIDKEIVCLWVEGNTAYIGSKVIRPSDSPLFGMELMFKVVDGGEGAGAVDYFSDGYALAGSACDDPAARAEFDAYQGSLDAIDLPYHGNVQIIDKR